MAQAPAYRSWGGLSVRPRAVALPSDVADLALPAGRWLPYGNGRSYGDSCLTSSATLIDMRGVNRILAFDRGTGRLRAEAGVLLGDIVRHVAGSGWFPAVLPGTQHVTLGGAIANDIHGKNHHRRGTFGAHVAALTLLRSDGPARRCGAIEDPELFSATIGGMGLTGLITEAEIQLMPAASHEIIQQAVPLAGLDDFFRLAPAAEERHEYVVAWLDSLAKGAALGRGVLLCGDHAGSGPDHALPARARFAAPFTPPISLVNQPGLRIFNALYRRSTLAAQGARRVSCGSFFFPLDGVGHWNRLYGPKGLRQHQSAIPLEGAEQVVRRMLEAAQAAGHGSLLTVIKLFGASKSPGLLSFPRPGVTLTLDFAHRGAATDRLLATLDELTLAASGRVNPYKDARMTSATFAASFPGADKFRRWVDPAAISDFALRVGLVSPRPAFGISESAPPAAAPFSPRP
jgi:FAD/FMN-containing dehydrogenase